ncbi:hypothetical protein HKBW3S09_01150, partial [Candidatus Hakubella thermalkaliphila]
MIWFDGVVPLTMKGVLGKVNGPEFFVGHFDPLGVAIGIDPTLNFEPCFRRCCGNQLDDYFMANEGFAPPVLTDERKEAMFDFVPLAGPWRKMTDRNRKSSFIGESLEFRLPQLYPSTITTSTVCGNKQTLGLRVDLTA